MLRSLVGSEMCIRDSEMRYVGQRHDGRTGEGAAKGTGARNDQQCSRFRPCLLYTSDAADDLLCVDLGGRRIIKKKK